MNGAAVPEATVDEDRDLTTREDNIGASAHRSWQIDLEIAAISQAFLVQ